MRYFLLTTCILLKAAVTQVKSIIDIDGGWSPWSPLATPCNVTCGGGKQMRVRSCTKPKPEGNGADCQPDADGDEEGWFDCNTHQCYADAWTEWTNCSVICGRGIKYRETLCGPDDNLEICEGNQYYKQKDYCNTWNRTTCPDPCIGRTCPQYAICVDRSTDYDPKAECMCTMGYIMKSDSCIRPPPTTPTPRPIPTLPPEQKTVAVVITKTASTVLLIFVGITLTLFFLLRIFTVDRVIQMNMEIALAAAHVLLLFPYIEEVTACRIISICLHFFFTACYMFMLLEALHMYCMVAFVVKKDGMFTRLQNTLIGWGVSAFVVLFTMCFEYEHYGGEYHCWCQMNMNVVMGQFIPVIIMIILIFTIIEAAGSADYAPLKGIDEVQVKSAKISQRSNLIIMPLVFASWLVGMLSEYEQNLALYSIFSILNGVLGGLVFFFHCTGNQQVRALMKKAYKKITNK